MRDVRAIFLNRLSLGPPLNYIALRKVWGVSFLIRVVATVFGAVNGTRAMAARSTGRSRTQEDLEANVKILRLTCT